MSKLIVSLLFAFTLVLTQPVFARGSEQAKSPVGAMFVLPAGESPSLQQVRDAIATAGAARGWRMVSEDAGSMNLYLNVRGKHEVTVKVTYDQKGFQVFYVSSVNMDHRMRGSLDYIHPKYNMWVNTLIQDVLAKVAMGKTGGQ
ncbi:hypothetical protein [Arenimonas sp.]|uniref:hypothetical protein n=1 Tax=Arenimonas sp. TaxID=1872635 RepID=UPI0039E58919